MFCKFILRLAETKEKSDTIPEYSHSPGLLHSHDEGRSDFWAGELLPSCTSSWFLITQRAPLMPSVLADMTSPTITTRNKYCFWAWFSEPGRWLEWNWCVGPQVRLIYFPASESSPELHQLLPITAGLWVPGNGSQHESGQCYQILSSVRRMGGLHSIPT